MRRSLISFLVILIISIFISACLADPKQEEEMLSSEKQTFGSLENETSIDNEIETEEVVEETSSIELNYGEGYYIDDEGNICYFGVRPPTVTYNGNEYGQYGNPWWNMDEDWLNKNYAYLGEAEYYPDYEPIEGRGDFTTNIAEGGCKIYKCNEEDTYLFTLWSDGVVRLFAQWDLTDEEKEAASAATEWKR